MEGELKKLDHEMTKKDDYEMWIQDLKLKKKTLDDLKAKLVEAGFDCVASLRFLTEQDLINLDVKKGHIRVVMDAVAEMQNVKAKAISQKEVNMKKQNNKTNMDQKESFKEEDDNVSEGLQLELIAEKFCSEIVALGLLADIGDCQYKTATYIRNKSHFSQSSRMEKSLEWLKKSARNNTLDAVMMIGHYYQLSGQHNKALNMWRKGKEKYRSTVSKMDELPEQMTQLISDADESMILYCMAWHSKQMMDGEDASLSKLD